MLMNFKLSKPLESNFIMFYLDFCESIDVKGSVNQTDLLSFYYEFANLVFCNLDSCSLSKLLKIRKVLDTKQANYAAYYDLYGLNIFVITELLSRNRIFVYNEEMLFHLIISSLNEFFKDYIGLLILRKRRACG